jgi:RNA polymerase sigma factor (sigma-70 family)
MRMRHRYLPVFIANVLFFLAIAPAIANPPVLARAASRAAAVTAAPTIMPRAAVAAHGALSAGVAAAHGSALGRPEPTLNALPALRHLEAGPASQDDFLNLEVEVHCQANLSFVAVAFCRLVAREARRACQGNASSIAFMNDQIKQAARRGRPGSSVRDAHGESDLRQDLFLAFWSRCNDIVAGSVTFTPQYLATISNNLRSRQKRIQTQEVPVTAIARTDEEAMDLLNQLPSTAIDQEEILAFQELIRRFDEQLGQDGALQFSQREVAVFKLRVLEDYDTGEVQASLGLTRDQVYQALHAARSKIARALTQPGG